MSRPEASSKWERPANWHGTMSRQLQRIPPHDDPPEDHSDDCECSECTGEPKIIAKHVLPPIPCRGFDWYAYYDGREQSPLGWGNTEQEAIDNLKEQEE